MEKNGRATVSFVTNTPILQYSNTPNGISCRDIITCSVERRSKVEKKVLNAMKRAGKPVRPGDVAKMIGAESKEVSKIMSGLKKKGRVISPKRCYYALSK